MSVVYFVAGVLLVLAVLFVRRGVSRQDRSAGGVLTARLHRAAAVKVIRWARRGRVELTPAQAAVMLAELRARGTELPAEHDQWLTGYASAA